ncbi:MAG: MFS transporter, partial [Dermatophilaceae bacterium]
MWRQPKTVWSVAFACVISFMGIGLVDPILKPIADQLGASPSQVSLLFTSYMAVMGIAMLGTGWVSSRVGAKRTLLLGLTFIIIGAGFAGSQDTVNGIVAFRALWGLGNALFIATALATIVNASAGSVKQAIILYEAALGVGIAAGPLLGGWLGSISWRWPFFGVAVLMVIAFIATTATLPATPPSGHPSSITAPLRALSHRGLLTVGLTALFYNFGFFTLLAFTPFPLDLGAQQTGLVFFGWGMLLAISSVFIAPRIQRRFGTLPGVVGALLGFAAILAIMAIGAEHKPVLIVCVVISGAFLGVNNTLITET